MAITCVINENAAPHSDIVCVLNFNCALRAFTIKPFLIVYSVVDTAM